MEPDKIQVQYKMEGSFEEEWEDNNSNRISIIGKYTGKFNPDLYTTEEINNYLYRNKKFYKVNKEQEVIT